MAYVGRGAAYSGLSQHQNAINEYTKAIYLDLDYALPYNSRSNRYRALGQYTLADADKTKACSLDSTYC